MFQNRRQSTLGNINLGSLSAAPSYQDMSFLLEQAQRYRGRFVEVSWHVPKTGATFQLTAKYPPNQSQPTWMLYRGIAGGSELVWGHTSNDLTLMHNLVMLECEKSVGGDDGNSISAGAMDNVMTNTRAAGGVASAPGEADKAILQATRGQTPAAAPAAPAGGTGHPAATWLQNLSESQTSGKAPPTPDQVMDKLADAVGTGDGTGDGADESPVFAGSAPGDLLLDGNLVNITMPKLLRYICHNRLTGRLALQSSIGAAEIFFKAGEITHAATLDAQGENGLLDACTWTDGEFHFSADDQTTQHTLMADSSTLVTACDRMLALSKFLQQEQVRTASYLVRNQNLTRPEFEQRIGSQGAWDIHQLWRVYELVDGNRCLSDLLRASPMTRAEWIPTIYTLLNSGLIAITEQPVNKRPGMFLEATPLDLSAADSFMADLCDETEQIFLRAPFLYFLQQEHHRFERTGSRYALALFSFATTNLLDGNVNQFTKEMMKEAATRIIKTKRRLDLVGHFDNNDYALLLPETDSAGAAVFANRIVDLIKKPPFFSGDQVLVASFGIASVPDDVRDLSGLVAAARVAKSKSRMMGSPVIIYGES